MGQENLERQETEADQATARRLGQLRTMPVDLSRLQKAIESQIPRSLRHGVRLTWFRPMRAAAAGLAVAAMLLVILITSSSGPALASAAEMARMHDELVSGKTPVTQVDSIQAANKALTAQWPGSPGIPSLPADHVMACCMNSVANKKVACVLLKSEGEPVTLTVANAADMKLPTSPTALRDGVIYHVQSFGSVNMVMTERHQRWVCLVGRLSVNRLIDVAGKLQF